MNLAQIKTAIAEGKTVNWKNASYVVIKDNLGQYFIRCDINQHHIGLTWLDGETLNGKEEDFFIAINTKEG
jgi:hypothetical protein